MGEDEEPRHLHAKMVKGRMPRHFSEKSRLGENLKMVGATGLEPATP
jgi:hypothetical protein